uniref:Uncharacterized protein n=1 Tax=Pyxicephalus adspersus TaxID=30357 RepID=A0AAV2ZIE2_PYXAD|nr:TPA: hypothetical protein GDO54_004123 [Pyxicephalus adspersus]
MKDCDNTHSAIPQRPIKFYLLSSQGSGFAMFLASCVLTFASYSLFHQMSAEVNTTGEKPEPAMCMEGQIQYVWRGKSDTSASFTYDHNLHYTISPGSLCAVSSKPKILR